MQERYDPIKHAKCGSTKSLHYIHIMELPVNPLICNRWLMKVYDPTKLQSGFRHQKIHVTLEEIGKRDDQIGFALEQKVKTAATYGYLSHRKYY